MGIMAITIVSRAIQSVSTASVFVGCLLLSLPVYEVWTTWCHQMWHTNRWLSVLHRVHHEEDITRNLDWNDVLGIGTAFSVVALTGATRYYIKDGTMVSMVLYGLAAGYIVYGMGVLLIHDGLCHRRIRVPGILSYNQTLTKLTRVHHVHHRRYDESGKGGVPFGFFSAMYEF
jgi:sterol desaturase/sphingolipid hydroxylase (fatty acid hydroxylase superfamily)